jgi:hypothetical protein
MLGLNNISNNIHSRKAWRIHVKYTGLFFNTSPVPGKSGAPVYGCMDAPSLTSIACCRPATWYAKTNGSPRQAFLGQANQWRLKSFTIPAMLSETFSQYAALMVMKQKYGEDKMQRFLRYELDRYPHDNLMNVEVL